MPIITTDDAVEIFYKDWGSGQPIVFHHGWPLSADEWDAQMIFFVQHGFRVIAHDRRGRPKNTSSEAYTIASALRTHERAPIPDASRSLAIWGRATLTMNTSIDDSTTPADTIRRT